MSLERFSDDVLDALSGISYVTDTAGTIRGVGASRWTAFSNANAAQDLTVDNVIGRSIFDFISGTEVKNSISKALGNLANGAASEWVMPYRCDSPAQKRNMRLSVSPIMSNCAVDGFLFQSVVLNEEQRPPLDIFDAVQIATQMAAIRSLPMISMCSWCQRIRTADDAEPEWIEAEEYYRRGGSSNVALTHTICPGCKVRSEDAFT